MPSTPLLPKYTAGDTGASPAQQLMGRLQTRLPILPERLTPEIPSHQSFRRTDEVNKEVMTRDLNRCHNTRLLVDLQPDEDV